MKPEESEALREAWSEFLTVMGLTEQQMTLGERLLFQVAFEKGRKVERSRNGRRLVAVPTTSGGRPN